MSSVDSTRRKSSPSEQPLIVAAYLHDAPSRKRRVKVPLNIKWRDFLALFYSRFDISPELEIEIYDEKGIEIVSVDDLVENDVLVVREKSVSTAKGSHAHPPRQPGGSRMSGTTHHTSLPPNTSYVDTRTGYQDSSSSRNTVVSIPTRMSHDSSDPTSSLMMGVPNLSHFIQSNSFGSYFLAEVENMRLLSSQGRMKKTHCVIKVPLCEKGSGTLQTFENEANLLRRIATHKCIVSAPSVQILNFSDVHLQTFYKLLPQSKRILVQDLFVGGGCLESYLYPLYGVTMATKIRTGLSPEKVLKYGYQLADVMQYLQQRGVIHLNLLPENIQVMSNDRLILCNFETAVQTDPTTCLLVVSQTVIAPSNKKGLAPEVVSALARLRIEAETVDYSTQYPWSFGLLSVVMATGQHPLKDYPDSFESAFRVKYRSHHFQSLPDPEQYPPIFCKLVKRSLSCDPVRRPTLPQILSIIKKDNKILSIMTKGRLGRTSSSAGSGTSSAVGRVKQERNPFAPIDQGATTYDPAVMNKPLPPHARGFYETHPPPSFAFQRSASDEVPHDQTSRHKSNDKLPRVQSQRYVRSPDIPQDPFTYSHRQQSGSHDEHPRSRDQPTNLDPFSPLATIATNSSSHGKVTNWDTFSQDQNPNERGVPQLLTTPTPDRLNDRERDLSFKRYGSQGTFSDDFVSPRISRESSGRTIKQGVSPSSLSVEMSQGRGRGVATSESDLSQMQEVPYRRLVQSPVPGNSSDDHPSPTPRTSDQERLVRASSPEAENTGEITRRVEEFTGMGAESIQAVSKKHTPEMPRSKISRSSSYRRATKDGGIKIESPLIVRRCFSDETSSQRRNLGRMDTSEERDEARLSTELILSLRPDAEEPMNINSQDHMTSQDYRSQSHDIHMTTQSTSSSGLEGMLMSSNTTGQTTSETQTTTTSFNLTSPSVDNSVRESPEAIEQMDMQSAGALSGETNNDRVLLSPVFSQSNGQPLTTSKEFWASVLTELGRDASSEYDVGRSADSAQPGSYLFSLDDISFPSLDPKNSARGNQGNPLNQQGNPLTTESLSLLSPFSTSNDNPVFPQAFSESDFLGDLSAPNPNQASQVPLLPRTDEDLTPKDGEEMVQEVPKLTPAVGDIGIPSFNSGGGFDRAAMDVSSWVQDVSLATKGSSQSHPLSSLPAQVFGPGVAPRSYDVMSPIPEASQELTSSMSQPNNNRFSGTHFRSVSPISEQTSISDAQRSVSPNVPSARSTSEHMSTPRSQSGTSEQGSTGQGSSVLTALNVGTLRAQQTGQAGLKTHQTSTSGVSGKEVNSVRGPQDTVRTGQTGTETHQTGFGSRPSALRVDHIQDEVVATLDHVSTSSESCDISLASSARAQVGDGIMTSLDDQADTPTQHTPSHTTLGGAVPLRHGRDSTSSSSPRPSQQLASNHNSSSESIEQGNSTQIFRGKSPQSTSSAPARIQVSLPRPQVVSEGPSSSGQRPLSPLATTTYRSTELLDMSGRDVDQSKQESQVTQSADHSQQRHEPMNGAQGNTVGTGIGHGIVGNGNGSQPPSASGMKGKRGSATQGSRFRYSQQRITDYPRSQQKISQDLEMMNLAISGMDFPNSQARSVCSTPPLSHERRSSSQQPTGHAQRQPLLANKSDQHMRREHRTGHAQRQPQSVQTNGHTQRQPRAIHRVEHAQIQPQSEQTTGHAQRQPQTVQRVVTTREGIDPSATFRPITPVLMGTFRSASAPNSSGQDSPLSINPRPETSLQVVQPQPTGEHNQNATVPPPPQVSADSYDYLPPYSPPRNREGQATDSHQRHVSQPTLLAEPPPSYNEIFGSNAEKEPRDRHRRRRRQGEERSRFMRRSSTSSHRDTANDNDNSQVTSRPSSRQSTGHRRLVSLTNLFKRSRRHTHVDGERSTTPSGATPSQSNSSVLPESRQRDVREYTADWVASYSHTPRPFQTTRQETLAVRSTGSIPHSQVSRTLSDTTNSRLPPPRRRHPQNPIPYRHPPPFPSAENLLQASSQSFLPPNHGSSQSLNVQSTGSSRLPVPSARSRNDRDGNSRPSASLFRSRPSSAYIATDTPNVDAPWMPHASNGGSTHSTPGLLSRRLMNTGMMSSSCFDILAPHTSTQHTSQPAPLHTSHSHTTTTQPVTHHTSTTNTSQPLPSHRANSHFTTHTSQPATPHTPHSHTTHPSTINQQTSASRIRGPRLGRENRGQSSTSSLNQQGTNLIINANTNNINVRATPRASATSSPVSLPSSRVQSPITFHYTGATSNGNSVTIGSHSQERLIGNGVSQEIEGSATPVNSSPSTAVNEASNNTVVSSVSEVRASAELSGRAAVRQRAESRRLRQGGGTSSDEDQHSQMSNLSQSSQRSNVRRRRRRRSQGSISATEVTRSNTHLEVSTQSENRSQNLTVDRTVGSHDQAVESMLVSHDQSQDGRTGSHDDLDMTVDRMERLSEERETQSIEVTIESMSGESTPNPPGPMSKSCGHPCEAGDQILCCVCTRVQRSSAFPGQEESVNDTLNSCALCERRGTNAILQNTSFHSNKHNSPRLSGGEPITHRNRSGKNCRIM